MYVFLICSFEHLDQLASGQLPVCGDPDHCLHPAGGVQSHVPPGRHTCQTGTPPLLPPLVTDGGSRVSTNTNKTSVTLQRLEPFCHLVVKIVNNVSLKFH